MKPKINVNVNENGWTNLDAHVFEKHTDYKEKLAEF